MNKVWYILLFGLGLMAALGAIMLTGIQPYGVEEGTYSSIVDVVTSTGAIMAATLCIIAGIIVAAAFAQQDLYWSFEYETRALLHGFGSGLVGIIAMATWFSANNTLAFASTTIVSVVIFTTAMVISRKVFDRMVDWYWDNMEDDYGVDHEQA